MRLYLSGPITGTTDYMERFANDTQALRNCGYEVVNPCEGAPEGLSHAEYMRRDLPLMLACDGVATMPHYERSEGCRLEVHVAHACGLPVTSVAGWMVLKEGEWGLL